MADRPRTLSGLAAGLGALLCLGAAACPGCADRPGAGSRTVAVAIGGRTFRLERALDDAAQMLGLSGRARIEPDGGMLFVFAQVQPRRFWMKDCLVPIDLIFLDPASRIVAMHEMQPQPGAPDAELRSYASEYPVRWAIELAGGTARRLGLRPGQKIELPAALLKPDSR